MTHQFELNGVRVWRGLRYSMPWDGTRDASRFAPICPQPALSGVPPKEPMGDDCLALNVWSPEGADRLPVLVWIHGGGYIAGSGSMPVMNGSSLAQNGPIVVVTLNYRLGHRGFLGANDGLRDQLAALRWVQDHIARFGGDPSRVTLGGQSAGGGSVCCLLASPLARGLFSRAIAQSPPVNSVFTRERADVVKRRFLELSAKGDPLAASATVLEEFAHVFPGHHAFQPVIDGEVLLDTPTRSVAAGQGSSVPLLIGSNEDEGSLFVRPPVLPLVPTSEAGVRRFLEQEHPGAVELVLAAYAGHGRFGEHVAIGGDGMITMPVTAMAEAMSRRAPTFLYRLRWTTPDLMAKRLGTPHTIDLPLVFGTHSEFRFTQLDASAPPLQATWLRFIRGEEPWTRYDVKERSTLVIGDQLEVQRDPDGARRAAW